MTLVPFQNFPKGHSILNGVVNFSQKDFKKIMENVVYSIKGCQILLLLCLRLRFPVELYFPLERKIFTAFLQSKRIMTKAYFSESFSSSCSKELITFMLSYMQTWSSLEKNILSFIKRYLILALKLGINFRRI